MTDPAQDTFTTHLYPALCKLRGLSRLCCPDDADELWSATAEKCWRFRDRFDPTLSATAWVATMMRNLAVTMLRAEQARRLALTEPESLEAMASSGDPAMEERIDSERERADQKAALWAGINQLDGFRRTTAIAMTRTDVFREHAQAEGIGVGTVGSRRNRTMAALREVVNGAAA